MLEPLTETKAIVLLADQLADAHRDLTAARMRIAELEAALREAHAAVPGGSICDPQRVADDIRAIADRVGVELQH